MDEEQAVTEPLFRANKRRKIIRKRGGIDEDDTPDLPAGQTDQDAGPQRVARRPIAKKHGVAYSSTAVARVEAEHNEETAMIPIHPSREQNVLQVDRFVKPTGRVTAVEEDKHMTAYVDSKLASIRSSSTAPTTPNTEDADPDTAQLAASTAHGHDYSTNPGRAAQAPRQRQRQAPRPRKGRPTRDETDLARDSLVDQILQESAVPLYDRSAGGAAFGTVDGIDNDEAAAEAFKAEFLASLEERNRRKPPLPPKDPKGAVKVTHGPKLGGSRAQRERMKAAEKAAEEEKLLGKVKK